MFRTRWKELTQKFVEVFDHCAEQTLWNTTREKEMTLLLTPVEEDKRREGVPHEKIVQDNLVTME